MEFEDQEFKSSRGCRKVNMDAFCNALDVKEGICQQRCQDQQNIYMQNQLITVKKEQRSQQLFEE